MKDLAISLIQSNLFWEEIDANLSMFEEKIWSIKEKTDLIILPEMFSTGFSMNPSKLAEPAGGKTFRWMRQMATQKRAVIVGSYIVKEGQHYFNRLCSVHPDGSSEQYDKKHLFRPGGEGENYHAGRKKIIILCKGWKVCPLICYDLRFPVWARSKSSPGDLYEYDLLIYAANWPDARINAWDTLLKARAIENLAFCAGINRTGTDGEGKAYSGHSAVYSFKGDDLVFSDQEETLHVELSAHQLMEFRAQFPFQKDADVFHFQG